MSKRWSSIIKDSYFIGRFVNVQSAKRTPKIRTLISGRAAERHSGGFPLTVKSRRTQCTNGSQTNHEFPTFDELPTIVATYNDLVFSFVCVAKACIINAVTTFVMHTVPRCHAADELDSSPTFPTVKVIRRLEGDIVRTT